MRAESDDEPERLPATEQRRLALAVDLCRKGMYAECARIRREVRDERISALGERHGETLQRV
jgi:hypothetical protein